MKLTLRLLCLFTSLIVTVPALQSEDSEAVKAAKSLFEVIKLEQTMLDGMEASIDVQLREFAQMGLPPEGVKELKEKLFSFFKEVMTYEAMEPEFIRLYTEEFTAEEMREMAAFYKTPVGAKSIRLMPKLTTDGMAFGQNMIQDRSREMQQRIIPVFQKHMPREPVQPAPPTPKE